MLVFFFLGLSGMTYAQEIYWVDGPGDWNDPSHWSKTSASDGINLAGTIPDKDNIVIIDEFSGLKKDDVLNVPPGSYEMGTLKVTSQEAFVLYLNGSSNNEVEMSLYGSLILTEEMGLDYADLTSSFNNRWTFTGAGEHDIRTWSKDLLSVRFLDENGEYNQDDNLEASLYLRMYGGVWNTGGHDVRTSGEIYFRDNNSSSNALTKTLNAAGSTFYAEEWDSKLTYGSFTLNGSHRMFVNRFIGSPIGGNAAMQIDELHLLEFIPEGGGSVIFQNSLECSGCIIQKLIIENTGETKMTGGFTVEQELRVIPTGATLLFNGGNSFVEDVTLNGVVEVPPVSECGERTTFAAAHTAFATFFSDAAGVTVNDAIIENIKIASGDNFTLNNGILVGATDGWNIGSLPQGNDFFWKGNGNTISGWNQPENWIVNGQIAGCLPTIIDNVMIDDDAAGDIRIPAGYHAECKDLLWTNKNGLELRLDGGSSSSSELTVAGNLTLDKTANINGVNRHEIYFNSTTSNQIITGNAPLPEITFLGGNGRWDLRDDLTCDRLLHESGTIDTRDQDVTTENWITSGPEEKALFLRRSHIMVNDKFSFTLLADNGLTLDPGFSLVECAILEGNRVELYDLKLNNTTTLNFHNPPPAGFNTFFHIFHELILAGTGEVRISADLTVDELVFATAGATLALDTSEDFIINDGISSQATAANPGVLKSRASGSQATVAKPAGALCVSGPVAFQDIDGDYGSVFHAPDGVDNGNNAGINFTDARSSPDLYWVGGDDNWARRGNWSGISGGCPRNTNPGSADKLIFDDNSLHNGNVVTVQTAQNCEELYFYNTEELELNINVRLNAEKLIGDGGYVTFGGNDLNVATETTLDLSTMVFGGRDFMTPTLNCNNCLFIARDGSETTVGPE